MASLPFFAPGAAFPPFGGAFGAPGAASDDALCGDAHADELWLLLSDAAGWLVDDDNAVITAPAAAGAGAEAEAAAGAGAQAEAPASTGAAPPASWRCLDASHAADCARRAPVHAHTRGCDHGARAHARARPALTRAPRFTALVRTTGRCTPPPAESDAHAYELRSDAATGVGLKLLRSAVLLTPEWNSTAARAAQARAARAQGLRAGSRGIVGRFVARAAPCAVR
jgi:hypothetical protein